MQAALSYKNIRLFCAGGRYAKIAKPCLRSIGCPFEKLVILFQKGSVTYERLCRKHRHKAAAENAESVSGGTGPADRRQQKDCL